MYLLDLLVEGLDVQMKLRVGCPLSTMDFYASKYKFEELGLLGVGDEFFSIVNSSKGGKL